MRQQGTKALQRELRELEIQLQRLGGDVSQVIPQGFNAAAASAGNLYKVISDLREELREITQGSGFLNSFSTHIKNILKDQTKLTNAFEAGNNVVKSMTTNAQELAKSAQGYKKLSTDQLETKMKEQQELMRIAKLAQEEFKYKRNLTDEEKEIYKALKQSQKAHESITAEIQKQLEVTKKQDDVAKLAGKGLDAMSKIPLVGKMMDTKKGMEAVNKAAEDGKGVFASLGAGISASFEGISKATIILAVIDYAVKALKFIKDLMLAASEQTANIRKTFAIGAEEAEIMRQDLRTVATLNKEYLATSDEIFGAQNDINKAIGVQYNLVSSLTGPSAVLVNQYAQAKNLLKLSENALNGILRASLQTGVGYRDTQKQILGTATLQAKQLGIQVNLREVLEQVAGASEKVKGDFGGTLESLTKGVVTLTKFGMTLENIQNTQKGLLDFETSFANELKAELLLSEEINLDRARYLAMTRDMEGLAIELNNLGITKAKLDGLNAYQLEAQAAALHMQSDELYDMVTRRENLNKLTKLARDEGKKLTDKELENATLILDALKAQGVEKQKLIDQVGEEALANLEAQSASDRFNRALDVLKDKLAGLVESGLIDRLMEVIEGIVNFFGPSKTEMESRKLKKEGAKQVGQTTPSEQLVSVVTQYAEANMGSTPQAQANFAALNKALREGTLTEDQLKKLNKLAEDSFFAPNLMRSGTNFAKEYNLDTKPFLEAEDFVIKTPPQNTPVTAGGTRVGEGATNSQQQPVFHAQIVMPNGAVLAKTTFDYASTNNYTM